MDQTIHHPTPAERVRVRRTVAAPITKSVIIQGPGTFSFSSPFPGQRSLCRIEFVYVLAGTTIRLLADGLGGEQAPPDPSSGQSLELEGIIIRGQVIQRLGVELAIQSHITMAISGTGIVTVTMTWNQFIMEFERLEQEKENKPLWGENIEAGLVRERR